MLNEGGAALGGPPVVGTLGVELIRAGGILAGFNPDIGGAGEPIGGAGEPIGGAIAIEGPGCGVDALGGGGVAVVSGLASFCN